MIALGVKATDYHVWHAVKVPFGGHAGLLSDGPFGHPQLNQQQTTPQAMHAVQEEYIWRRQMRKRKRQSPINVLS